MKEGSRFAINKYNSLVLNEPAMDKNPIIQPSMTIYEAS